MTITKKTVNEIIRVAHSYIVIVPWQFAIIEPHFAFPFFGALPEYVQEFLIRHLLRRSNADAHIDYFRKNFIWRSNNQYKKDFPNSSIVFSRTLDTIAIVTTK